MSSSKELFARNRLQWVENVRLGMTAAIDDDVVAPSFQVFPTVDAIRFILKITLHTPLGKDTRGPLRDYIRAWAKEFNCDVPIININNTYIQAEILTRERVWSRDAKGRFNTPPRFSRRVGRGGDGGT